MNEHVRHPGAGQVVDHTEVHHEEHTGGEYQHDTHTEVHDDGQHDFEPLVGDPPSRTSQWWAEHKPGLRGWLLGAVALIAVIVGIIFASSGSSVKDNVLAAGSSDLSLPVAANSDPTKLGLAITKGLNERFEPRFSAIEGGQKKLATDIDQLRKDVGSDIEKLRKDFGSVNKDVNTIKSQPAFDYDLLTATIAGRKK